MFFFPFRADLDLDRIPVVSVLICILCLLIHAAQVRDEHVVDARTEAYCRTVSDRLTLLALSEAAGDSGPKACAGFLLELRAASKPHAVIGARLAQAGGVESAGDAAMRQLLQERLERLHQDHARTVPVPLTRRLWYEPQSWNPLRMITATFAHGSWVHVAGNLLFFYAFAATLEVILSAPVFLLVVLFLSVSTHVAYSLATLLAASPLPTVGLSGVVMGVMALFTYFLPSARIRCFAWIVVFFRVFAVPAWWLTAWYVGIDVYGLFHREAQPGVNLVAHVSGAALGLLAGVAVFRARREALKGQLAAAARRARADGRPRR